MKPNTKELLINLERMDWFCNAGKALEATPDVQPLQGWSQAMEVCPAQPSKDARLEASNELSGRLSVYHNEAYSLWNTKVEELKPLIEKLVHGKLAISAVRARIPDDAEGLFVNALRWDLLGLCMAREYEDLVRTRYYELLEHWYMAGRFPCGWIGAVPDDMEDAFQMGKLAVL